MTRRVGRIVIIEAEPDMECEQCGKIAETRPYGPDGIRICYECGQKNEPLTSMNASRFLEGKTPLEKVDAS